MKKLDPSSLDLVYYPDPRLRRKSVDVKEFDAWLARLTERMFEIMYASRGIGLAAPQVGLNVRLFVYNESGKQGEGQEVVVVNPVLGEMAGAQEYEEGCLSLPGVNGQVLRATQCRLQAYDVQGKPIDSAGQDMLARIWQHETDHLDGVLLLDRFSEAARIANRRAVRELESQFKESGKGAKAVKH